MTTFQRLVTALLLLLHNGLATDLTTTTAPSASSSTLGNIYRQARSDQQYYSSRYNGDNAPLMTGSIRSEPIEHRDAAYFESRCITCDPSKSPTTTDRSVYLPRQRQRPRYEYYDDELEDRRYRDRYDPYYDRQRDPYYDYDRYDPYKQNDLARAPPPYYDRYEPPPGRDRYPDRVAERPYDRSYDRGYERMYERGNGYDNLDPRNPYDEQSERPGGYRRPYEEPYNSRYDRYNRNRYDRYDPYERSAWRRPPYDERNDRPGGRSPPADARSYYGPAYGPSYDRGYASSWNYSGRRDNWRDINADRDSGVYRPRDYFYDSTAAPGGSRGTSYQYDRTESSTKDDLTDRDKATSSPNHQDNKSYKD